MKKQGVPLLVVLTLVFACFTVGFFLGRDSGEIRVELELPREMETPAAAQTLPTLTDPTEPTVTFPIDLNTAGETELTALPGIGPTLAQRILAYRQAAGGFTAVEELMHVEGIGEKRMEAIAGLVCVGG